MTIGPPTSARGTTAPTRADARRGLRTKETRMPAVKHMKWWGWGVDGISFHHEDKPALGPFVREAVDVDVWSEPTSALKLEDLDIHPPKIGDELRAQLIEAVGAEN